jgi:hypothetical protein
MTARYPSQLPLFTPQTDGVDGVNARDVNVLYEEVDAIAAELGLTPSGSAATVSARIGAVESAASTFVLRAGGSVILPTVASTKGLSIRAQTSQSANLFEVKDSADSTTHFAVGPTGALTIPSINGGSAF